MQESQKNDASLQAHDYMVETYKEMFAENEKLRKSESDMREELEFLKRLH